jgi:hypothetical protein
MKATMNSADDRAGADQRVRAIWVVLILAGGTGLSTIFACATPFAALATLSALKLGRQDAITVMSVVWLANQAIGYGLLGYPWTWDSGAWGLAIGASIGLAILAATALSATRPVPFAVSLPFVAAFAAFELGLYGAGFALPGSEGAFSASVVGHVFLINAIALCGLLAVFQLAVMARLLIPVGTPEPRPVGAPSYR